MRLALVLSSFLWLFQKYCLPLTVVDEVKGTNKRVQYKINIGFSDCKTTPAV